MLKSDEFRFSVIGLEHNHVNGQTNGLLQAGAVLVNVYDEDPEKVKNYIEKFPQVKAVLSEEEILRDPAIQMIVSVVRPDKRASMGLRIMRAGKHCFSDKPGMLALDEVAEVRATCAETGKKFFINFAEHIQVESAIYAGKLIREGAIGRVIHVTMLAPHRLIPDRRPAWFWDPKQAGGILADIGSHQFENFLTYTSAKTASITSSRLCNYNNPAHPGFFDFGDCSLVADNGATGYFRIDWFTPDGLCTWGDCRSFIVGTEGTIEIRKYLEVGISPEGDHVYLVNKTGEHRIEAKGKTGLPFFADMIQDCINRTDTAMTQDHIFESMRLALEAQEKAKIINI